MQILHNWGFPFTLCHFVSAFMIICFAVFFYDFFILLSNT